MKPGDDTLTTIAKTPLVESTLQGIEPYERGYWGNLKAICCHFEVE